MPIEAAHPILSCADAQAWEKQLFGGDDTKEWIAMSAAGRALGAAVRRDAQEIGGLPDSARVFVLCGKGHNGGDALIALHGLLDARPQATALVLPVPDFASLRPLTRRAIEELWRAHHARVEFVDVRHVLEAPEISGAFDLCLDGLLGMQFRPPLRAPATELIKRVNAADIRLRVAVDLPSGVGDTSDAQPFRADFTYATGTAKLPLFAAENRASVGRVRYLDLGFFEVGAASAAIPSMPGVGRIAAEAAPTLKADSQAQSFILIDRVLDPLRAVRPAHADKRTFGHLFVVSGSRTMPGAVLMSVESALLSGAGLVTAFVPESLAASFAARLPEAMWVPMPETLDGGLALEGRGSVVARAARCTALLAGPGLGRDRESLALIAEILRAIDVPAVLDGDALQTEIVAAHYPGSAPVRVLTPHAGEYQRIAGEEKLPDAAKRLGATIVLKGAPTRVCESGAQYVSTFGGPVLSRGGSGDVLAGIVAGQLAQGVGALESAARGVVWHGLAADRLARAQGQTSARVTQLIPHLAAVLLERA
jgi:ADP-dependent NAD(P)H-hydrate dehydratase / NAD(P)H-hydrate epimerase